MIDTKIRLVFISFQHLLINLIMICITIKTSINYTVSRKEVVAMKSSYVRLSCTTTALDTFRTTAEGSSCFFFGVDLGLSRAGGLIKGRVRCSLWSISHLFEFREGLWVCCLRQINEFLIRLGCLSPQLACFLYLCIVLLLSSLRVQCCYRKIAWHDQGANS